MVNKQNTDENENEVEITSDDLGAENSYDDIDSETVEKAANDKIKKLQSKLQEVTKEKQELLEQLQRTKADHLNARKRLETEKREGIERAQVRFIENILPLCDSFRMAMSDQKVWEQVDEQWRKGVEGILSQLNAVLTAYEVTVLDPQDEEFDPHKHEALSEQPVTDKKAVNKVCQVIQPGYEAKISGNHYLIRPARVVVGISDSE